MAEVKWIKITTDIFEDDSIGLIEQMPEGDTIIVIWFKLLTKAGKTNDNGQIYFKQHLPYTDEMLSSVFKRPLNIIRLALQVFQQFGMVEITDTNTIFISNWEKHQNVSGMEQIKEYNRLAKEKQRAKTKELKLLKSQGQCQGHVKDSHETDRDIDLDIENTLSLGSEGFLKLGEFEQCRLTQTEYNNLQAIYFNEPMTQKEPEIFLKEIIEQFDNWLARGHDELNHYATLISWIKRDISKIKEGYVAGKTKGKSKGKLDVSQIDFN